MIDTKVSLNGVEFKNPVIAASGTFGFGREYGEYFP
ncbi:MAG: dihydroorotate dehydrogenase, partial [Tissierellia bacterium]|nr:dihydroorotate dehydrogenase [Tissierellia bacterium]